MLEIKVKRAITHTLKSYPSLNAWNNEDMAKLIEKASNRIIITPGDRIFLDESVPFKIDYIFKLRQYMFKVMAGL